MCVAITFIAVKLFLVLPCLREALNAGGLCYQYSLFLALHMWHHAVLFTSRCVTSIALQG